MRVASELISSACLMNLSDNVNDPREAAMPQYDAIFVAEHFSTEEHHLGHILSILSNSWSQHIIRVDRLSSRFSLTVRFV
jgi:hypothetical protein